MTHPEYNIRLATVADACALTAVMSAAREAALPYLPKLYSRAQLESWMRETVLQHCRVWVAEADAEMVGLLALDGEELHHLYIHPDYWSQGIGSRLLAIAKQQSAKLRLYTFQRNTRARRFYRYHGFKEVSLSDGAGNEEQEPDVLLEWEA